MSEVPAYQRKFAASMMVHALRDLQPLFDTTKSNEAYFNAVEALVWFYTKGSDEYFHILSLDPDEARMKIDLALYAQLALTQFPLRRDYFFRMYVAMARYSLRIRTGKVPYAKIKMFAEEAVKYTESILHLILEESPADNSQISTGKLPAFLAVLTSMEEQRVSA
jgi:hypothetical protein